MKLDTIKQRAKAFDYLFDAVVVTNLEGIITDWNKGSEILYGYTKEEAIGQVVRMLHVPEDTEHVTAEVMAAVASHGKWSGEIRSLHKDGRIGWVESMCVPFFHENGEMLGALGVNRDITERVKKTEKLEYLAHYDHLTKIPNRYLLLDRVKHLIAKSERDKLIFGFLFLDLKKNKKINDSRGHSFGDKVLHEFASRLEQSLRNSDTVARFGGDEFVVLLENIHQKSDALALIENLAKILSADFVINEEKFNISCSIGLAIYPDDGHTTDALIAIADRAMYKAKIDS